MINDSTLNEVELTIADIRQLRTLTKEGIDVYTKRLTPISGKVSQRLIAILDAEVKKMLTESEQHLNTILYGKNPDQESSSQIASLSQGDPESDSQSEQNLQHHDVAD